MWPFSSKPLLSETKASRSGGLLSINALGAPRWTPRRYDKLAEEGYRKNVIAFRCIREIAQNAASIPLLLYRGKSEIIKHPLLDLLAKPNPQMGQMQLLEALYSYQQICGNAYLEAVRAESDTPPRELWPLRPDRMKVLAGAQGVPAGYEYSTNGKAVRWAADPLTGQADVLHFKAFHPLDDWYGQGALEAALLSIDQHNAASTWNQSLLQNAARPTGALVYAPKEGTGNLSEEQFRRLRQELDEQLSGSTHAGRPLLLEGGLDWRAMSLTPTDMDWNNGRDAVARDIALAFGVPAQLIGLPDAQTFSNMKEARLAFYEDTILPLAESLCAALNNWLTPMFGDDLRLVLDLDQVPALQPRREALWAQITAADFLTAEEKRTLLGF